MKTTGYLVVEIRGRIEALVLSVNHRNGGTVDRLDFSLRLLDPGVGLDSLDLAEVVVDLEKQFGRSPFDSARPPRTWEELAQSLEVKSS
jgi:acyl carrier protein